MRRLFLAAAFLILGSAAASAAAPSGVMLSAPGSSDWSPATIRPFGAAWIAHHPRISTIQPGFRGINLTTFGGFMHRIVSYDPATGITVYASGYRVQIVP